MPAHSPLLLGHSSLPFARLQTLKTLKTILCLHIEGSLGHSSLPFARLQTLKTLKTLLCLHRLLIGVQGCRLPGLKPSIPSKTLQTLQKSGQLRREKVPQQAQHAPLPHAKATTRPQQWLKSTPRPQQWLLIGVQGFRLLGLKPSIPSKTLQTLQESGQLRRNRYPNKPNMRHSRTQKPPQGHSNGSRAPPRPQQWLLIGVPGCRLPGLKPSIPSKTLQKSGQLRREQVPQQAQHAPLSHAKATTRPQQWLKSTPRPQQWLLL